MLPREESPSTESANRGFSFPVTGESRFSLAYTGESGFSLTDREESEFSFAFTPGEDKGNVTDGSVTPHTPAPTPTLTSATPFVTTAYTTSTYHYHHQHHHARHPVDARGRAGGPGSSWHGRGSAGQPHGDMRASRSLQERDRPERQGGGAWAAGCDVVVARVMSAA